MRRNATHDARARPALVVWGILWALAVVAIQGFDFGGRSEGAGLQSTIAFWLASRLFPAWCFVGWLYLRVALAADRHDRRWAAWAGWLAISLAWAIAQPMLAELTRAWADVRPLVAVDMLDLALFNLWYCLVPGGLLVAAWLSVLRAERTRSLLEAAAIARARTTAALSQNALSRLQRRVDPALLLDVMSDVERRYRAQADDADALLGHLVDFLRCAQPGLRGGSTLEAEIALVQAHARLQAARGSGAHWAVDLAPDVPPLHGVPFPAHVLLPLLDQGPPDMRPTLQVRHGAHGVVVRAQGLTPTLAAAFAREAALRPPAEPARRPAATDDAIPVLTRQP